MAVLLAAALVAPAASASEANGVCLGHEPGPGHGRPFELTGDGVIVYVPGPGPDLTMGTWQVGYSQSAC